MGDDINNTSNIQFNLIYNSFFGVLFSLMFIVGLLGNLGICIVIVRNKSMHNITNCYLFALAIADTLLILNDLNSWIFALFNIFTEFKGLYCVFEIFVAEIAIFCSLFIVTCVSVTRYVAVCYPLQPRKIISNLRNTIKVIIAICVFASCLSIPSAIRFLDQCTTISFPFIASKTYNFITSLCILFLYLILIIFIAVIYWRIIEELKKSTKTTSFINRKIDEENQKVVRMLYTMIIGLFICWMPSQVFRPIYYYLSMTVPYTELDKVAPYIEIVCGFLFYSVSTVINPILFNIMSEKFREAFRKTFFRKLNYEETSTTFSAKTNIETFNLTSTSSKYSSSNV